MGVDEVFEEGEEALEDDTWADDAWPLKRAPQPQSTVVSSYGPAFKKERETLKGTKGATGKGKGAPQPIPGLAAAIETTGIGSEAAAAAALAAEEAIANGVDVGALNAERTRLAGGRGDRDADITRDWKLTDKDFSIEAHKKLTLSLASIVVNHDLRLKVIESIILHVTMLSVNVKCYTTSKADTKQMHVNSKGMSKDEIALRGPTYIVVYYRIVEHGHELANSHLANGCQELLRFNAYWRKLEELKNKDPKLLDQEILDTVRYARFRSCHDPRKVIMEVGHVGLSEEAEYIWRLTRHLLVQHCGGCIKAGVAPKSALIRRVEASLRRLKVWRNQS
jgi:hypothetical protein